MNDDCAVKSFGTDSDGVTVHVIKLIVAPRFKCELSHGRF